ncbi:tRNA 2-thiouridine(34) synthase MnmA [Desulfococcaceae bacterium HSG9]|nr:tRNA 2-thiouridine(34) synthase MnmA [Desulfococcaceae bacterium HSG9]
MVKKRTKVAIGLSGGVDSSVAAVLLLEKGFDVVGISMSIYDGPDIAKQGTSHSCYSPGEKENTETAAAICRQIGIPFRVIDLKTEFRHHVINYVRQEYLTGRTPNPCIICNRHVKFGFLPDMAKKAGICFDYFATGHYARIVKVKNHFILKKPVDISKDQTYFLYALTQKQLSRTLFPIGDYSKQEVRKLARSFGLGTAERPESQDFISGNYATLFKSEELRPGDIIDDQGKIIGQHRGIVHYTVGQRRGLGIAHSTPLYVMAIDTAANQIIVGEKEHLYASGLIAENVRLNQVSNIDRPYHVTAKIRLRTQPVQATVYPYDKDKIKVIFEKEQKAVTPGQSVVFYYDDIVFGGGVIKKTIRDL